MDSPHNTRYKYTVMYVLDDAYVTDEQTQTTYTFLTAHTYVSRSPHNMSLTYHTDVSALPHSNVSVGGP